MRPGVILHTMDVVLDQLPDDVDALKAIILSQRAEAMRLEASVVNAGWKLAHLAD